MLHCNSLGNLSVLKAMNSCSLGQAAVRASMALPLGYPRFLIILYGQRFKTNSIRIYNTGPD